MGLTSQTVQIKRAYEPATPDDGFRVYIDRLWPQGLSHETFKYDWWDKDIAPSTDLREWFHEDPTERWAQFANRYTSELEANPAYEDLKEAISGKPVVTLLYSSKNEEHNNAVILCNLLTGKNATDVVKTV